MAKRTAEECFWERVDRNGPVPDYAPHLGPCWVWTASTTDGYGRFRSRQAHCYAYEALIGPVPEGLQLDHLCRVRHCVNPAHLEPVTCRENVIRGTSFIADNVRKTHCPKGHPFAGDNLVIKITPAGYPGRYCKACAAASRLAWKKRNFPWRYVDAARGERNPDHE